MKAYINHNLPVLVLIVDNWLIWKSPLHSSLSVEATVATKGWMKLYVSPRSRDQIHDTSLRDLGDSAYIPFKSWGHIERVAHGDFEPASCVLSVGKCSAKAAVPATRHQMMTFFTAVMITHYVWGSHQTQLEMISYGSFLCQVSQYVVLAWLLVLIETPCLSPSIADPLRRRTSTIEVCQNRSWFGAKRLNIPCLFPRGCYMVPQLCRVLT